jgi:hypothetical protein
MQDDRDDEPPAGPLRDLAEALNPGNALQLDVPFALTPEVVDEHRDHQPSLFTDNEDQPCE